MATSPHKPQDTAAVKAAILSILAALAGAPAGSPAAGAFLSALRRRGEELSAIGGIEALREVRAVAIAASSDHAAAIDGAWSSIPGWTV